MDNAAEGSRYVVSPSPHVSGPATIEKGMRDVLIALIPALGWCLYLFGLDAILVVGLSVGACMLLDEGLARLLGNQGSWKDGSAAVTGLLLGLNLGAASPWWLVLVGAFVAILLGKHLFGGLGHNPFNPAILARVVLLIAFPAHLSTWPVPEVTTVDVVSGATPLTQLSLDGAAAVVANVSIKDLLLGTTGGSLGEMSALALLLGGIYLLVRRTITWHTPVAFIGSVAAIAALHSALGGEGALPPLYHVLGGGLMLGALFMATDWVTSPMTGKGQILFGLGCGIITMVIRIFGSYPEGVSFAILLMNGFTPLIDRFTMPRRFGTAGGSSNG